MIKRVIYALTVVLLGVTTLSSCGAGYHATEIVSGVFFQENFLKENRTYGACYVRDGVDPDKVTSSDIEVDVTSPVDRTFIIRSQEELEKVFSGFPEVDFGKEMILLYIYTSPYGRSRKIKSIDFEEQSLTIRFTYAKGPRDMEIFPPRSNEFLLLKWIFSM